MPTRLYWPGPAFLPCTAAPVRLKSLSAHKVRKGRTLCAEWHETVFDRAQHQIDQQERQPRRRPHAFRTT